MKSLFTREMKAVIFVVFLSFFSGELLSPILPLFMQSKGLSAQNIGTMFSVMTLGVAISEIFWGWLVDRIDLKIAILMATLLYGLVISGFHITNTVALLTVVVFVYGFSRSPVFIVGRWYMGVYAPEDMKVVAMAILATAIAISQSLSGFASGYIAEAWGYGSTIWLSAAISVGAGMVILIAWRRLNFQKSRQTQAVSDSATSQPASIDSNMKMLMGILGLLATIYFICFGTFMTYLPLFASDVILLAINQIGILFAIRGIVQILTMIPLGRLSDRMDKRLFVLFGMGCVALSMIGMALARNFIMLLISTAFFSLGTSLFRPTSMAIISQTIPVHWIGTAMGIYGLMEDLGIIMGSSIGGVLWETKSVRAPFLFSGIAGIIGVFIILVGRRVLTRGADAQRIPAGTQD